MSKRVGPHYNSFVAQYGIRCGASCEETVTHWACSERYGDKHFYCEPRCETHGCEGERNTIYRPIEKG
ncbi:hypothetical protein C9F11_10265 [Streptomyces sp. YIM 121038]|nr:hypothetical protein C9F11_10265 [Streptomyces sp. YIM 121038]